MTILLNRSFLTLCAVCAITMTSCEGSEAPPPGNGGNQGNVDTTLNCKSPEDAGGYYTFYKPQAGWVGDPMPFYNEKDDTFYLFFLQDWRDGRINDHPIYYTTTKDYAKFTGFYEAVPTVADEQAQDVFIGTGSFVESNGLYYSFYTGHNGRLNPREKVMVATSTDMRSWTKQPDRTFQAPEGYDQNNFRDPHVYYDPTRDSYVMLVTTIKDGKGCFARFTSSNLVEWTHLDALTEFESDAEILECPDIFNMGDKWYLTFSRINRDQHRKTFYRVADSPDGPWRILKDDEGAHETFDGLFFYAGKTASNGTDRYISGWCSTDERVNDNNELGWAGALVTHKLVQTSTGRLYPVAVDAVLDKFATETAHKAIVKSDNVTEEDGVFTVGTGGKAVFNRNGSLFKITMSVDASASDKFGIAFDACNDQKDAVRIEFDLTADNEWGMPCIFRYNNAGTAITFTPLVVPADKMFDITVVAEKGICVVYVNDQVAFTNRINKMNQNPWMIYCDKGTAVFSDIETYR